MRHILNNVTPKGDARADGSTPSEVLQYIESMSQQNANINAKRSSRGTWDWVLMRLKLAWFPIEIVQKTIEITTQLAKSDMRLPLLRHFKSRFPQANVNQLRETFLTDTFFSSKPGLRGE